MTRLPRNCRGNYDHQFCQVCRQKGHNMLFRCPEFPKFIPRGSDAKSIPNTVCKLCLNTPFQPCDHGSLRNYREYMCTATNQNFLICNQCEKHTISQDWMKKNFNPRDGRHNLTNLLQAVGNDNVIVN